MVSEQTERKWEREWWRDKSPEHVLEVATSLDQAQLHALLSEIKAACATMSLHAQDKTLDPESRGKASRALAWTVRKKRLLQSHAQKVVASGEGYDHKRERVETMLEAAEAATDPLEAVRLIAATMRAMWNMED